MYPNTWSIVTWIFITHLEMCNTHTEFFSIVGPLLYYILYIFPLDSTTWLSSIIEPKDESRGKKLKEKEKEKGIMIMYLSFEFKGATIGYYWSLLTSNLHIFHNKDNTFF